ncbi:MAG: C45 family peptidase [Myxococcota bacterium]
MSHPMQPVVFDQTDPRERGRAHGELWRDEVGALADLRLGLTVRRSRFASTADVLTAAGAHVAVLEQHLPDLHAELLGIAEGSGQSAEAIVVLNHYTDLRDVPPSLLDLPETELEPGDPGGCTAIYFTGIEGPILGQTWDMHATAEPFVRMMSIEPAGTGRQTLCFTLTGCLGMAGLGHDAVGVTINNLSSTDGSIGVVWPAVVRAMLDASSAQEARARLLEIPLSSGHYYTIADGRDFFGYETSGQLKVLTQTGPRAAHLHTNHCFDPVLRQREAVPRLSTTFHRLNMATTLYAQQRPSTLDELWNILGSHDGDPASLCTHQDEVHGDDAFSRTCGRVAMRLRTGEVRASRGCSKLDAGTDITMQHYNAPPELPPGALSRFATLPFK